MDSSLQLLVSVYAGAARADEVYRDLHSFDQRLTEVKLGNVAIVRKGADGQVTISETHDVKHNTKLVGSFPLVGMLVGLIAGRMGILRLSPRAGVALGGAAGLLAGVAVAKLDPGFRDEALQQLGMALATEQSAIVLLVRASEEGYVRAKLTDLGGTLIQDTLAPATIAQLTA